MGDLKNILHLYQRAGFGLSPEELSHYSNSSLESAIADLFDNAKAIKPLSQINIEALKAKTGSNAEFMRESAELRKVKNMDWLNKMVAPGESLLREKMTLFWHGHFACHSVHAHVAVNQNNGIRKHALGKFKDLLHAICNDPGMLVYLNADNNKKGKINENFGRELLELFTIGIGNYTQKDVVEASRAFTGWSYTENRMSYLFREKFHDSGQKTFLNKKGAFNGSNIIDILLEQKATARFITKKIYVYFVNENAPKTRIDQLASQFYQSDYDIEKLMKTIFSSSWFYDKENKGNKIKSPIELIGGIMKVFNVRFKDPLTTLRMERDLGQILFEPPSVAGWPASKLWINNSNIFLRINLARFIAKYFRLNPQLKNDYVIRKKDPIFHTLSLTADTAPMQDIFGCCQPDELPDTLIQYLLPVPPLKFKKIRHYTNPSDNLIYLVLHLMSLPEYQVC